MTRRPGRLCFETAQPCGRAVTSDESGRLRRQRDRTDGRQTFGRDGVVPPMPMASTGLAFFLDVRDFTTGGQFAVTANHAAAGESGEAEKPNETHTILRTMWRWTSNMYARWHAFVRSCERAVKRRINDEQSYGTLEMKTLSWICAERRARGAEQVLRASVGRMTVDQLTRHCYPVLASTAEKQRGRAVAARVGPIRKAGVQIAGAEIRRVLRIPSGRRSARHVDRAPR